MSTYVPTAAIRDAVKGRDGRPHISCPYPAHQDDDPSWRWDERREAAR